MASEIHIPTHQETIDLLPFDLEEVQELSDAEVLFLNRASLDALTRQIKTRDNGGEALSTIGVVSGSYADPSAVHTAGRTEGTMLNLGGRYANRQVYGEWRRVLVRQHTIRGFGTFDDQRAGFTIPMFKPPGYAGEIFSSASYSLPDGQKSMMFHAPWNAKTGAPQVSEEDEDGVEDRQKPTIDIYTNTPVALILAMSRIALASGIEPKKWVRPQKVASKVG